MLNININSSAQQKHTENTRKHEKTPTSGLHTNVQLVLSRMWHAVASEIDFRVADEHITQRIAQCVVLIG